MLGLRGMDDEQQLLTYVGPPGMVSALAQMLDEHGVKVAYDPPHETKDLVAALAITTVVLEITGPVVDVRAAVRAFTSRFPQAKVTGLPEEAPASIEHRLARLDQMLDAGTISMQERADQRARILGEV